MGIWAVSSIPVALSDAPTTAEVRVSQPASAIAVGGAPAPLPVSPVVQAVPVVRKAVIRPMTVEGAGGVSLEQLRRESVRFPDQGITGRFIESATELPPLFGSDTNNE